MRLNTFQKITVFCILSLIVLIFVGAIVRVTGAGMGCPDWPKCWGKYIPPSSLEVIDVDALVNHKDFIREYKEHAGEDAELTPDGLREMFNPRHTWTEYINRLFSMPIGLGSVALLAYAQMKGRKRVSKSKNGNKVELTEQKTSFPAVLRWGSFAVFFLVIVNAIVGMLVVKTGLSEGVITLHMALAILLLSLLVYLLWKGADTPRFFTFKKNAKLLQWAAWTLFILVVVEGIMGSQVRELTDALQKNHNDAPRSEWTKELEGATIYLIHRSFSWGVLAAVLVYAWLTIKVTEHRFSWVEGVVVGIVFAQMVLGLLLAQYGVFPVVQVLHIGLSSILVSCLFYWLLCARKQSVS